MHSKSNHISFPGVAKAAECETTECVQCVVWWRCAAVEECVWWRRRGFEGQGGGILWYQHRWVGGGLAWGWEGGWGEGCGCGRAVMCPLPLLSPPTCSTVKQSAHIQLSRICRRWLPAISEQVVGWDPVWAPCSTAPCAFPSYGVVSLW